MFAKAWWDFSWFIVLFFCESSSFFGLQTGNHRCQIWSHLTGFIIQDIHLLIARYRFHTINDLLCFPFPIHQCEIILGLAHNLEIKFRLLNKGGRESSLQHVIRWPASRTNGEINTTVRLKLAIMNTDEKSHHYGSLRMSHSGFNCGGWQLNRNLEVITQDVRGWGFDLMR